jgi:hypothetical protein
MMTNNNTEEQHEFPEPEPRGLQEIEEAEAKLHKLVWYNRHQNYRIEIEEGTEKASTSRDMEKG